VQVRGADEYPWRRGGPQTLEVEYAGQDAPQRVQVERADRVRRKDLGRYA
jgi:hypothetical protein